MSVILKGNTKWSRVRHYFILMYCINGYCMVLERWHQSTATTSKPAYRHRLVASHRRHKHNASPAGGKNKQNKTKNDASLIRGCVFEKGFKSWDIILLFFIHTLFSQCAAPQAWSLEMLTLHSHQGSMQRRDREGSQSLAWRGSDYIKPTVNTQDRHFLQLCRL